MKSFLKNGLKTGLVAVSLAALCSCSSPRPATTNPPKGPGDATREAAMAPARPLTENEAKERFRQIAHVSYDLWFGLDDGPQGSSDEYQGKATIHFVLRPKASGELFVDFHGGPAENLRSIRLNGSEIANPEARYDGNRIHFQLSELRSENEIEIDFARKYATNGHGLYRFKDPEDGKIYLYTDDEPAFAHEFFPCFDQPDLKASYKMTVEAPRSWQVVTNTLEKKTSVSGDRKTWFFTPTQPLSTYLVALIAGPYVSWKGDADGIPMRLFARASLRRFLDQGQAREWLDISRRGLAFYAEHFGHPYPYGKYDQILVPDFDEGAMENAGAVTFTEKYVFHTRTTRLDHIERANTILHEMAHMWFGDLVTMKWWNGLWLNESFATFMSAWSVGDATQYKESWQDFYGGDKSWAYWQDQLVTTHPIELPVPDTDHAFSNFDGITYGKGASVLKQLRYYLGEDDFIEGVQRYFDRYANRNSTLHDFIRMLSEASGKNLDAWQEAWLRTPGMNTVRAEWSCAQNAITSFDLVQGNAPESSVLRPHRTEIALFEMKAGKYVPRELIPAEYSAEKTPVTDAIGKPCPAFVYPNYGDEDYVKVELDPVSLEVMSRGLGKIADPLLRQMYWGDLWNEVVDGKLAASSYVSEALENLSSEHDLMTLQAVLDTIRQRKLARDSAMKFISPSKRAPLEDRLEALLTAGLRKASAGSDAQLAYFNALVDEVHTPQGVDLIRKVLTRKTRFPGLKIDQAVRWSLVAALARNGASDAAERIEAERSADPSHYGEISRLEALAQIPTKQNKAEWFAQVVSAGNAGGSTKELSASDLHAVMSNFSILGQGAALTELIPQYFDYLPKAASSPDEEFMYNYTRALYPAVCEPDVVDATSRALDSSAAKAFPPQALKNLKTHLQEEQRCVRARAVAGASAH